MEPRRQFKKTEKALQQVATPLENGLAKQVALNTDVSTRRSDMRAEISASIDKSVSQTYVLAESVRQGKFVATIADVSVTTTNDVSGKECLPAVGQQKLSAQTTDWNKLRVTLATAIRNSGVADEIRKSPGLQDSE